MGSEVWIVSRKCGLRQLEIATGDYVAIFYYYFAFFFLLIASIGSCVMEIIRYPVWNDEDSALICVSLWQVYSYRTR